MIDSPKPLALITLLNFSLRSLLLDLNLFFLSYNVEE